MDAEKLIELVRGQEFLFNHSHKCYYDANKKERAWKAIGEELGQSAQKCKKHWTALRDSFRKILRKRKSNQSATVKKKWRFEDEMIFLLPHLHERSTASSLHTSISSDDDIDHIDDVTEQTIIPTISNTEIDRFVSGNTSEEETVSVKRKRGRKERPRFAKKTKTSGLSASPVVIKYLPKNDSHRDEVETLFYSLAQTVKRMDPYHRALAKSRVCSIIGELEIQSISHQSLSTACTSSPVCTSCLSSKVSPIPSPTYE